MTTSDMPTHVKDPKQLSVKREDVGHIQNRKSPDRELDSGNKLYEIPDPEAPVKKPVTRLPVALFGHHVEMNHGNNNQPFITEFEASDNETICQV